MLNLDYPGLKFQYLLAFIYAALIFPVTLFVAIWVVLVVDYKDRNFKVVNSNRLQKLSDLRQIILSSWEVKQIKFKPLFNILTPQL